MFQVRILSSGLPHCLDVGVFPHPFSCKKFINCYRNPGQGITGSIYQCPSYLAFDPVGGRCNWANEFVCAQTSRLERKTKRKTKLFVGPRAKHSSRSKKGSQKAMLGS